MIQIEWERLADLLADGLGDLAINHWDEAENDHLPLDLDWPEARKREHDGTFKIAGVRRDGELIGYAYFLLGSSLQHRGTLQAWCEGMYVDPDVRGAGALLLRSLPRLLTALGVRRVTCAAKPHVLLRKGEKAATLGDLLSLMGWTPFEAIWVRNLKVS